MEIPDSSPTPIDRDPGGHSWKVLYSAKIRYPGCPDKPYVVQWCEACGLVMQGPYFEQSSGPVELWNFYRADGSLEGHGWKNRPACSNKPGSNKEYEVCSVTTVGGTEVLANVWAKNLEEAAEEARRLHPEFKPTYSGEVIIVRTCYADWLKNGRKRETNSLGYKVEYVFDIVEDDDGS